LYDLLWTKHDYIYCIKARLTMYGLAGGKELKQIKHIFCMIPLWIMPMHVFLAWLLLFTECEEELCVSVPQTETCKPYTSDQVSKGITG